MEPLLLPVSTCDIYSFESHSLHLELKPIEGVSFLWLVLSFGTPQERDDAFALVNKSTVAMDED